MRRAIDYDPLTGPLVPDPGLQPAAAAIAAFARSNGWEYYPTAFDQPLPGAIFRTADGHSRSAQVAGNIVRIPQPVPFEVGNSSYQSVIEGNAIGHRWGYAAVRLNVAAPAITIEAHRHRGEHPLPALPELPPAPLGDDDRAFDVYAAPSARGWVASVFDTEVLAALDDGTLAFDVEISSGWFFLYAPGELSTTDPALWHRVFGILDLLLARIDAASSTPAASSAVASDAASVPLRERRWRVERRIRLLYIGAAVFGMGLFGVLALVFGGH